MYAMYHWHQASGYSQLQAAGSFQSSILLIHCYQHQIPCNRMIAAHIYTGVYCTLHVIDQSIIFFLNQACAAEIALVRASVCVCVHVCVSVCLSVCLPPRPLIISGMIWCNIDRVRLVKQVLGLFPAFNYFIWQLPSIKWMGGAILTQLVVNACQRKLR